MFFKQMLMGVKRPAMGPLPVLGDNAAMHQLVTKEGKEARMSVFGG